MSLKNLQIFDALIDNISFHQTCMKSNIWDKVFKNGPSKICGGQLLENFICSILESFVPY